MRRGHRNLCFLLLIFFFFSPSAAIRHPSVGSGFWWPQRKWTIHGDRRVYSVPCFRPGIDPFIWHPSRTGKMPVYRAPCICSPILRDTTTSMAREPSAKPPHASFFGIAKRRTSSRYQSEGRKIFSFRTCFICLINFSLYQCPSHSIYKAHKSFLAAQNCSQNRSYKKLQLHKPV